jgi:hypothetical protein
MFSPHPDSVNRLMMQPMRIVKVDIMVLPPVRVKTITKSWRQERLWICPFTWVRKSNEVECMITRPELCDAGKMLRRTVGMNKTGSMCGLTLSKHSQWLGSKGIAVHRLMIL